MSRDLFYRRAATAALIALSVGSGPLCAGEHPVLQEPELRRIITELRIEGLSLSLTPDQAHENLLAAGYRVHKGTEPGHGIYWKNGSGQSTRRIRLKSSEERIYQIQLSFAEKNGTRAWQPLLDKIRDHLGSALHLCETATAQELNCRLFSEAPTQLSAEITAGTSNETSRIRVRLDQRTRKISIKSNMSFGSPRR